MAPVDYSIKNIEKHVKFDGKVKNIEVSRLTAPGENYLSLVLRVDFEVQKNGHSKTISSVAKRLPPIQQKGMMFDMHAHTMKNEIKWYSEIIPILKDFAKEYDIEVDIYPQHYGSRLSLDSSKREPDSESFLLLENLIPEGYSNDDRYIGSDLITTKAILKGLALFHALPIAMKVKKPETFKIIKDFLDTTKPKPPPGHGPSGPDGHRGPPGPDGPRGPPGSFGGPDEERKHFGPPPGVARPDEILLEELVKIPEFAPYISKIKPLLAKQPMGPEAHERVAEEPWNTITHNDFWVNNIMINRKAKEPLVKIVDFQMCFYGSYAKDLMFFLLSSVKNDVTKEYMDDLLRCYYEEFTSILRKAKTNLELTFEEYMKEVRIAAESEAAHAITFSTIIFGTKGMGVDLAVESFELHIHMTAMIKNMNQYQKDKLVLIASEAIKRKWV